MKPSILIVTSVHPPDDPRIRIKSAGTLADGGWDVTLMSRSPGPHDTNGITVRVLEGSRMARSARAVLAMFRSPHDVVVVHDPELLVGAIPLAMVRGRHRVVFDLHEDLPRQLATRRSTPSWMRAPMSWVARAFLRIAESVMTVTLAEPQYARLFKREHAVFRNLPVPAMLPTRSDDAQGIVYVGDVTRDRGAVMLVEAVADTNAGPLTLIGRCDDSLANELKETAAELGVDLRLTGYLPYAEAWQLAARSLVGVSPLLDLPNYHDSLPTKLLEYRSVGLITVASDLPGGAEVLGGSRAVFLFAPGDGQGLSEAIRSALSDSDTPVIAIEESADVRRQWSWDAAAFREFYNDLIRHAR